MFSRRLEFKEVSFVSAHQYPRTNIPVTPTLRARVIFRVQIFGNGKTKMMKSMHALGTALLIHRALVGPQLSGWLHPFSTGLHMKTVPKVTPNSQAALRT